MERNLICKNDIVDAIKDYTPNQVKLFYYMLYEFKAGVLYKDMLDDEEFVIDLFDIRKVLSASKITQDRIYDIVDKMPNEIRRITPKEIIRMPVFNYIEYDFDSEELRFMVNPIFAVSFLEILSEYTIIQLKHLTNLNSKYSQRLYELARRFVNQGNYNMRIADFKEYFQVPKSYKMSNIDQTILTPAIRELGSKTNIKCRIQKNKRGRKVTHIKFFFTKQDNKKEATI